MLCLMEKCLCSHRNRCSSCHSWGIHSAINPPGRPEEHQSFTNATKKFMGEFSFLACSRCLSCGSRWAMSVWTWTQTVLSARSIRRISLCKGEEKLSGFSFGFFCCSVGWLLLFGFLPPGQWLPPDSQHRNRYLINHWPNSNNDSTFGVAPSGVVNCILSGTRLVLWSPHQECQAFPSSLPWKGTEAEPATSLHPGSVSSVSHSSGGCHVAASPRGMFI